MTLYVLLGLSWFLVGLACVVLRLAREDEPEARWRLLLAAALTPFLLFPLAGVCRLAIEQVGVLVPILDSPWPLVAMSGAGAAVALARMLVIRRHQGALLAACRPLEPDVADTLVRQVRQLSRAAGLRRVPRLLAYPRGGGVCVLGLRRPTIVISRGLLGVLGDEELRAVLAHEIAHIRRRDYVLNWLGVVLRLAFFYLPPWSVAWETLAEVRERQADRLATRYTGDPMALAAALVKVWRQGGGRPVVAGAVGVLAPRGCLEARIRRLLEPAPIRRPVWRAILMGVVLVGGLVLAQTTVEGATHLLARVSAAAAEWEACCDPELSAVPHCAAPRRIFLPVSTTACSRGDIGLSSRA
jgi:Zn-dependent protease with chaperone function